jgi:hypothetical protein
MASQPDSKSSSGREAGLELPATPADVAALREAAKLRRVAPEDYLAFLAQFSASVSQAALRARKGPRGEPFRL